VKRLGVRARLAALLGLLLIGCGVGLLAISYGLVSENLTGPLPAPTGMSASRLAAHPPPAPRGIFSARSIRKRQTIHPITPGAAHSLQQRLAHRTLHQLVIQFLAVLAGVVVLAVGLGWLLAGRLLGPLRRVTSAARRVSGRNLHERISLRGPRDELRDLADTFDLMLARLEAAFTAQRRFIADASHELRTPLATMRAEIEVLESDPSASAQDVRAATATLRRQLWRSEELIRALLTLARSQPELLGHERLDLASLVRQTLIEQHEQIAGRELQLTSSLAPAPIEGDRALLTQTVANLLSNAVKHNRVGGRLEIRTGSAEQRTTLEFANDGQAIPSSRVPELLLAFRRGGTARTGDGLGLGLTIVETIVIAHDGGLTLEPRPQGGLRVEVTLPAMCSASHARAGAPVSGNGRASPDVASLAESRCLTAESRR
jgi:signal transduction histidine kinase